MAVISIKQENTSGIEKVEPLSFGLSATAANGLVDLKMGKNDDSSSEVETILMVSIFSPSVIV